MLLPGAIVYKGADAAFDISHELLVKLVIVVLQGCGSDTRGYSIRRFLPHIYDVLLNVVLQINDCRSFSSI